MQQLLSKTTHLLQKPAKATINLRVFAGVAKPTPKMGQALGPLGINMMQFCKEFNAQTTHIRPDVPMKVRVVAYEDRTFQFVTKPPETSWFIRKCTGISRFTNFPGHIRYDEMSLQSIYEIAKLKQEMDPHLRHVSLQAICRTIIGQLSSMGVRVSTEHEKPSTIVRPVVKV